MIEMLTGSAPWSSVSRSVKEVMDLITSGQIPPIPSGISADCKDFIENCLREDFCNRPTAQELLCHRFLDERYLNTDNNFSGKSKIN